MACWANWSESAGGQGYCCGGGVGSDSGVPWFPRMAERMEYSRLAASEPKGKLESNGAGKRGSFGVNGSAKGRVRIWMEKEVGYANRMALKVVLRWSLVRRTCSV